MCSRFSYHDHHDHACPDDLDNILMIISFSLHGVPYARQEHHGKASANILQIANHHHHHRHHHCVFIIAIVDFIGITSAAMMIITVHCTRQRGGKSKHCANCPNLIKAQVLPGGAQCIMIILHHVHCESLRL
jgi:exopolyphosphatase/pppGpp-phosphohydrolase